MTRNVYKPALDGVRAICILLTIANHVPGAPYFINGTMGVDIFFALSGWLITCLLLSEQQRSGMINLKAFYTRRAFRIIPLYLLTIILYGLAALAAQTLKGDPSDLADFRAALPWMLTFNSEYRELIVNNLFGHSWTLGIEEKFYILWPLFLVFYLAGRRHALIFLIPILIALITLGTETDLLVRGYWGLGAGTLLAITAQYSGISAALGRPLSVYTALAAVCVCFGLSRVVPFGFAWNMLISLAAAFLIGGLWTNTGSKISKILSFKPLTFAGRLTYAIYLTHALVINVVVVALAKLGLSATYAATYVIIYACCVFVGTILHIVVEQPLIEIGRRPSRVWKKQDRSLQRVAPVSDGVLPE